MFKNNRLVISSVCSLAFVLFSFFYLYLMQGESLRLMHRTLSEGGIPYSPFWGALILTVVLWLARWGLNLLTRFRDKWLAVSYFPAYLSVALISSLHPAVTNGADFHLALSDNWWLALVLFVAYVALAVVYQKQGLTVVKEPIPRTLIPNLLVLLVFTYVTGAVGNSDELLHRELVVAQRISEGDFEEALQEGKKSLHNSRTLMTLRSLALSHVDSLGQALFSYPRTEASEGLFFDESRGEVSSLTNQDIYNHLGGESRLYNETPVHYLRRLCEKDSCNQKAQDYYLCALLLERQLESFVKALERHYKGVADLPRHYQEALLLYEEKEGTPISFIGGYAPSLVKNYQAFKELEREHAQEIHRRNYTRRKFGDTYWWYYWYGE